MKIIGFKVLSDIVALVAFYWGLSVQWHAWRCNYKLGLQRLNFRFLVPNKLERIFGLSNLAKNESVGGGQKVREWVQKISFFFSFFFLLSVFFFGSVPLKFVRSFLAPTGALIVIVVYYTTSAAAAGHFLRFLAFLPIYLVFLFENWMQIDNNWPWGPWWL